jgi:hypothetical protein
MTQLRDADLDRQVGAWLRDEAGTRAPGRLVEDVFARTTRTPQASRWWPPLGLTKGDRLIPRSVDSGTGAWAQPRLRAFVQAAAFVAVIVAVVGVLAWPRAVGPVGSPELTSTPSPTPGSAVETPRAMLLDGSQADVLSLAANAAPVDVIDAFGPIWVAESGADAVVQIDPTTMARLASISGVTRPTWFTEAGPSLWVTQEGAPGIVPIDPTTLRAGPPVGSAAACGRPVFALGSIWGAACDADVIMRIEPAAQRLADTIPAAGHTGLVFAASDLIASGPAGLARFDPETKAFTEIGACCGTLLGSDGATVWLSDDNNVRRIDPANGRVIATFPYRFARGVGFAPDHAWLTVSNVGVVEIDLTTNEVMRTIPQWPDPTVPLEAPGALWVTDHDRNELWRIKL